MGDEWDVKICCIGAGYVGGPTMAVIAKKCPKVRRTLDIFHGVIRDVGFGRLLSFDKALIGPWNGYWRVFLKTIFLLLRGQELAPIVRVFYERVDLGRFMLNAHFGLKEPSPGFPNCAFMRLPNLSFYFLTFCPPLQINP
jgi:UDP-glucose/GDP-mannose dehydrogenase family, NAD binding domain